MNDTTTLLAQLTSIHQEMSQSIANAQTAQELEQLRIAALGKKGTIAQMLANLKDLPLQTKREVGPRLQMVRQALEEAIQSRQQALLELQRLAAQEKAHSFDVTITPPPARRGGLHPFTHAVKQIQDIFLSMGFEQGSGPEVESEFFNFDALNIPQSHPARDMHDTFWTTLPGTLLRTHTSNVQIHTMSSRTPPIAMFVPGNVYRYEAVDASHDFMFMQLEGFVVDKGINMGHLLGTVQAFFQQLFNRKDLDIRIRPSYYPFVEPGIDIDMRCVFCTKGCSVCKQSTWIEIAGAGMIHPNVLKACNIDSQEYSGFAFGMGLTRLVMLRYGIDDIRLLHGGKVEFLEQF